MRVTAEKEGALARARIGGRTFGEALARARADGTRQSASRLERRHAAVAERTEQDARRATAGGTGEPTEATGVTAGPAGRAAPGTASAAGGCGREPAFSPPAVAEPPRSALPEAPPDLPPLRELVRALPPAIDAARVRDGQPLELAFGSALRVDLRVGRDGVELTLRPDARLTRAAHAELPGLVRALSARGVRLARAAVGPPLPGNDPGGSSRVDLPRALG